MEEADLLKERLQAITDKRKVQDDIAKKRRQIEEEKLKLQCLKKKALREQWLMDGLSPQSEEDQEATKLQAQDDQEQTLELQSDIDRIEKEIEALERQELQISANEEVILKRLKEVERTAEDIIKDLIAEYQADPIQYIYSPIPDMPDIQMPKCLTPVSRPLRKMADPHREPDGDESDQVAMFAMEINVAKDMTTGESQVVSTATITPEDFKQKGQKVFDDGKKSVYALHSDGQESWKQVGVGEMSNLEVEELLRQASDVKVPTEVQYHNPVYAAPYTSKPLTNTWKPEQGHVSNSPARPNSQHTSSMTQHLPSCPLQMLPGTPVRDGNQSRGEVASPALPYIPKLHGEERPLQPRSAQSRINGSSRAGGYSAPHPETKRLSPVIITVHSSGESRIPIPLIENTVTDWDRQSPVSPSSRQSPFYSSESAESSFNVENTLPLHVDSEPVTMIFMGYQNAEEEEDDENLQAELVVIGNGDEDEDNNMPSYHPQGYQSKIFQPTARCSNTDVTRDQWNSDNLQHLPTFTHKPGKHSPCQNRQTSLLEDPTTVGINTGKRKCYLSDGFFSPSPSVINR